MFGWREGKEGRVEVWECVTVFWKRREEGGLGRCVWCGFGWVGREVGREVKEEEV